MSKDKDEKIAELEQAVADLTAERILHKEPEVFTTYHHEMQKEFEVDHTQCYVCDDCAYDDGHLRPGIGYACGRSNDNNTPIGEYDWKMIVLTNKGEQ